MITELKKYPNLNVELFAQCNGRCVFCLARKITRSRAPMPDETFKKIIEEVSGWDESVDITPHGYSEPFLNPRWFEQYKYIQDNAPNAHITIATNGILLDDAKIDNLVTIRSLTSIVLSAYAIRPKTYIDLMGIDPSNLERLDRIADRIATERPDVEIVIGCSLSLITKDEWIEFWNHWSKKRVIILPHPMIITYKDSEVTDSRCSQPCPDLFGTLQILNNGVATGCCVDSEGDLSFGNVNEKTILEIWNGAEAWVYRNLHMSGMRHTISMCRSCSRPCDMTEYQEKTLRHGEYPPSVRCLFPSQMRLIKNEKT